MKNILENKNWDVQSGNKSNEWVDSINNEILSKMKDIAPNFKILVSCILTQKVGAGLHYDNTAYWDPSTDGTVTAKYENNTIICICTIFGIAI